LFLELIDGYDLKDIKINIINYFTRNPALNIIYFDISLYFINNKL